MEGVHLCGLGRDTAVILILLGVEPFRWGWGTVIYCPACI